MKQKLVPALFFLSVVAGRAADPKYPVSDIPEDFSKGMYAVVREKSLVFEILDHNRSAYTYHLVVTILNSRGKDNAEAAVAYDKEMKVEYFRGFVYDASGNLIRKLKSSEVKDQSNVSGFSLFEDDRVKIADLSQVEYPYTVEFEYKVEMKFLFWIPDFMLYNDDEISIQRSTYQLIYPKNLKPRYRLFKVAEPSMDIVKDGRESATWSFEHVIPEKFEKDGPQLSQIAPNISVAPDQFEYGGYAGRMDTWEDYGKWQLLLNKGRNALPESTIEKVRELTKDKSTTEAKTKAVYEYLQGKTRYVSIQLGIGGYQPFEARTVDEVSYGDCKALSNYTVALLGNIGVKAYYCLIYGGRQSRPVDREFVDNYFNHIVVAVPNGADTLWLECTSQTNPFGYSGQFTGDRKALLCSEDGSRLVNTPRYPADVNVQARNAEVTVDAKGNATSRVSTRYRGLQYEDHGLEFYVNYQKDEQKKWLEKYIEIPTFDIAAFNMANMKEKIPSAVVNVDLILNKFASVSGKRMFLTPNLMNRSTYVPAKLTTRKTNIVVNMGYQDFDSIRYRLPDELYPEFLPDPINIKSRFGEYEVSFKLDQGTVLYTRKMTINKGEYPPDSYNEYLEFYKSINKADHMKLVFLNKT